MASKYTNPIVFPAVSVSHENAPFEDPTDGEDAVTVAVEVETVCSRSLVMRDLTTDFAKDLKAGLTTDSAKDSRTRTKWGLFPRSDRILNISPIPPNISPISPRRMS